MQELQERMQELQEKMRRSWKKQSDREWKLQGLYRRQIVYMYILLRVFLFYFTGSWV